VVKLGRKPSQQYQRVRTPTLLQLEAVECGAAALGMILGYHGKIVPATTLRRACGVSRDGSNAWNIVKAARSYGMLAKGFSKTIQDLQKIEPPYIIFWNFNHFVVVEGFGKNKVFLNDPASGHRTVSDEEFEQSFTGVVLVLEPGPEFQPDGSKPSLFKAVSERLSGSSAAVAFCVVAGFLLVIPGLAIPAFSQIFLDNIFVGRRIDWLRPVIVALIVAALMQAALKFIQLRYLRRFRIALSIKLANRFMWQLLRLPSIFYAQRYAGEVANRSLINDKLSATLSGRLAQTAIDVVMMVFYALLMFYYDAVITSVGVAFALVNVAVLQWISKRRVEANMRVLNEYGKAHGVAIAGLQGMETIKSGGLEPALFAKWSGYYAKAANARQQLETSNQSLSVLPSLVTSLSGVLVVIVGGYRIISGHLSIGMLVAMQSLLHSFMTPMNNLMLLGGTFQELEGDLNRVNDVLEQPVEQRPTARQMVDSQGRPVVRLKGYVTLKNATFGYSPLDEPLVKDFNLTIRPGQRVALVGGSGSGKTTVSKLISGEYKAWAGDVSFDGIPRDQIPEDVMVNSFGNVAQDIFLFGGTVRDNLTLWDSTIADQNVVRACQDAAIHDTVLALPGGYDAPLLEGGGNLSGGQRQRLEIARALVNDPSILVLDEATSALDARTEAFVIERLRMRGCSCVVVSHRLSTIRDCDEIIVLEKGKVVERGTHDELWAANSHYARLIRTEDDMSGEQALGA
jgi:ATP-binding cassette subfamily C protein